MMMKKHTAPALSDEETFSLLRNALLVAGDELGGKEGDHWPVVKQTIHELSRDVEERRLNRQADAEMKRHLYAILREAEADVKKLSKAEQDEALPKIKELREIFDAYFEPAEVDELVLEDIPMPQHVKTAAAILETWEEENE
jgi:hypothetical protein